MIINIAAAPVELHHYILIEFYLQTIKHCLNQEMELQLLSTETLKTTAVASASCHSVELTACLISRFWGCIQALKCEVKVLVSYLCVVCRWLCLLCLGEWNLLCCPLTVLLFVLLPATQTGSIVSQQLLSQQPHRCAVMHVASAEIFIHITATAFTPFHSVSTRLITWQATSMMHMGRG